MPTKPIVLPDKLDLEQFISKHAHDMRTPFNHIIGFSKMTLNTVGDAPLTDYQKEDLGTIYRSGMRALTVLNGLIDIARLQRGEKDVVVSQVIPGQMLEQSLANWKKFNPNNPLQIETHTRLSLESFQTDEQLTRQVIVGFISFVAQYCESSGRVILTLADEADRLTFSFTSKGMKVRQVSELDVELWGYIGRALVELQHGQIKLAEENDEGAIIQFCLPVSQPAGHTPAHLSPE